MTDNLRSLIVEAHIAGHSQNAIARMVGMTRRRVRTVIEFAYLDGARPETDEEYQARVLAIAAQRCRRAA